LEGERLGAAPADGPAARPMVDPVLLASDIVETTVTLAIPGILWAFLYLVAWEDPVVAAESGFGRRSFWLLFPVSAVLLTFGLVPFFAWGGVVLGISVAGGLIPVLLSVLFLRRLVGPRLGEVGVLLLALAAETAVLFALVLLARSPLATDLAVLATAVAFPAGLFALERRAGAPHAPVAGAALGLFSAACFLTFLVTEPVPGLGIVSLFPYYLLAPIVIGVLAGPILRACGSPVPGAAIALAYAGTTFGTLVGADVLQEPPLFSSGIPGFYLIGGAGVSDLLYLSGLLAAAAAYGYLILTRPARAAPATPPAPAGETPYPLLQSALDLGYAGRDAESIRTSARAADQAVTQARRLLGRPGPPPEGAWYGLGVPIWVEADHRNLSALARSERATPVEAGRAWTTARWLVRLGREIGDRRRAAAWRRALAFLIDIGLVLVPAALVWVGLAVGSRGDLIDLLESAAFEAAAFGFAGYAYLYLVLAEAWTGTTLGKRALGLVVTDRALARPGPIAALLRNSTKIVPLLAVGITGALVAALSVGVSLGSVGGLGPLTPALLAVTIVNLLEALAVVLAMTFFFGWLFIHETRERQRLGDYLAGTWVLNRAPPAPMG
jgi:hypothetical protein